MSVIDKILEIKDTLPKKQKQLCDYLVINYAKAGIMTVSDLAKNAGTGTTTVIRLINLLGYDTYSNFKKDLYKLTIQPQTSSYHNIKQQFSKTSSNGKANAFVKLLERTSYSFEHLITEKNIEELDKASNMMIDAKTVNILGFRVSNLPSLYLEMMLDVFFQNSKQLSYWKDYAFDNAYRLTKDDILVVFSIWPCTRQTIELADIANKRDVPIVLITNTSLNPIAKYADAVINTDSVNSGCGILPSMFIAETLVSSIGKKTAPQSTENVEKLENYLNQHDMFIWDRDSF